MELNQPQTGKQKLDIFVKKSTRVNVDVYAWVADNDEIEASYDKNDVPKNKSDVHIIKFVFRKPNYADSNAVLSGAKITGEEGKADIMGFQEGLLRNLLIEIRNGDEVTEARPRDISALQPSIARAAVAGLLDVITI